MALQTRTFSQSTTNWYTLELVLTEESTNISANTSQVAYTLRLKSGNTSFSQYGLGAQVSLNGSVVASRDRYTAPQVSIGRNSTLTILTGTTNISHSADGTKTMSVAFSIDMQKASYTPGPMSVTGNTMTLTSIPRATEPGIPNTITMGNTITISLPRASSSFTHTLTYSFGNASGTIGTGCTTSANWAVPLALANQVPNSPNGSGTITCKTYNGVNLVGTLSVPFTASVPASVVPSITSVSITEATQGIFEAYGGYVQNKSTLRIVTQAAGSYGSNVKSVRIELGGTVYTGADITTNPIGSADAVVSVTVTDTRERSVTAERTLTVIPYEPPTVSTMEMMRSNAIGEYDDQGEYLSYNISYDISPINNLNSALYQLQYKRAADTEWTVLVEGHSYGPTINATSAAAVLDGDYPYNVRLLLRDDFETVCFNAVDIPEAFTLMDQYHTGRGITFGRVAQRDGFNIYMPISIYGQSLTDYLLDAIYPIGSIYMSANQTNPALVFGGTWEAWGSGRVPVGVDTSQTEFNSVEKVGGSKHLQSHNHTARTGTGQANSMRVVGAAGTEHLGNHIVGYGSGDYSDVTDNTWNGSSHTHSVTVDNAGSGNSGNLPPYITCYMWKRTA